jgi:hypothetical protein
MYAGRSGTRESLEHTSRRAIGRVGASRAEQSKLSLISYPLAQVSIASSMAFERTDLS